MKIHIEAECEIDDEQVKMWEEDQRRYYNTMYKDNKEKIEAVLKENDFCKAVADEVDDLLGNIGYICDTVIVSEVKQTER